MCRGDKMWFRPYTVRQYMQKKERDNKNLFV